MITSIADIKTFLIIVCIAKKNLEEKDSMKQIKLTEEEINLYYKKALEELKKHPTKFTDTSLVIKVNNKIMKDRRLKTK